VDELVMGERPGGAGDHPGPEPVPPRRPTITDVAREARVSIKTVSRVVNNQPSVRAETADRVLTAVRRLGFRRNDTARALRSGRPAASVGLIIEDLANPFYSAIAAAVEEVARRNDTLLITASSEEDRDRERRLALELCERRVDGLLVVPAGDDHGFLRPDMEMGIQAVFLDRPPSRLTADTVVIDNVGGARAGVAHLVAAGHRRIAILVDRPAIYTATERLAGARAAIEAGGLTLDSALVRDGLHDPAAGRAAVAELLGRDDPPTAFFASNNRITVGVVEELWWRRAEADVVGFDDFELSHLLPRPVTVVAYDVAEIGRAGAELLFGRIAGDSGPTQRIVVPTTLVQRGIASR
jgi:LacI family transcriptional regulator